MNTIPFDPDKYRTLTDVAKEFGLSELEVLKMFVNDIIAIMEPEEQTRATDRMKYYATGCPF